MKKTSSRIMAIAMTVALLASLIVGVLPVSAAAPTGVTASASSTLISANATYTVAFDPTSALANPIATSTAVAAAATFNVTAGTTVTFDVATNLTFTTADPVVWTSLAGVNSFAAAPVAPLTLAVGAGDQVKFSVTNVITTSAAINIFNQMPPTGATFPVGVVVVKFPASFPLPQIIDKDTVNSAFDNTLPLDFAGATAIPVVHVAVNNSTNEVAIALGDSAPPSGFAWASSPGQRIRVRIPLVNPGTLGDFLLSAKSSVDTTYADAASPITIAPAPIPGVVSVYNASGNFLGSYADLASIAVTIGNGYRITLTAANYDLAAPYSLPAGVTGVQIGPATGNTGDVVFRDAAGGGAPDGITLVGTGNTITNVRFAAIPFGLTPFLTLDGINNTASNITTSGAINIWAGSTGARITNCTVTGSITVSGTGFSITGSTIDKSSTTSQAIGVTLNNAAIVAGTISGNTFKVSQPTTAPAALSGDKAINVTAAVSGVTITDNTFTGSTGGIGYWDAAGAGTAGAPMRIQNNTFTSLESAVVLAVVGTNTIISNNTIDKTITNNVAPATNWVGAIEITVPGLSTISIQGNIITNSAGYSINITSTLNNLLNTVITGNSFRMNAKGLNNASTVADVPALAEGHANAVQNWWGDVTGPTNATLNPAGKGDAVSANVIFSPFLTVAPLAGGSAVASVIVPTNYDFRTTSGLLLVGLDASAVGDVISTQRLTGNPKTINPPFPVIGPNAYYDIYLSASPAGTFQIQFHTSGLSANTQVYYYSPLSNSWVLATSQGISGTGDFAYVNVGATASAVRPTVDEFTGTPFVLVNGPGTTPAPFAITAPTIGTNQPLTGISFTWAAVAGATSYTFNMANNSAFATPLTVNQASLTLPVYQYTGANLVAGTTYFWRVIAYQGNAVIANSQIGYFTAGAAATGTVTTSTTTVTAPPVTSTVTPIIITQTTITFPQVTNTTLPTPTIIITTNPPVTITFTQPQPTITTISIPPVPGTTTITPAWIWGIIGIGAILIIVVIVLIVRTRRSV